MKKCSKGLKMQKNFLISYSLPVRSGGLIGYFTFKLFIIIV